MRARERARSHGRSERHLFVGKVRMHWVHPNGWVETACHRWSLRGPFETLGGVNIPFDRGAEWICAQEALGSSFLICKLGGKHVKRENLTCRTSFKESWPFPSAEFMQKETVISAMGNDIFWPIINSTRATKRLKIPYLLHHKKERTSYLCQHFCPFKMKII